MNQNQVDYEKENKAVQDFLAKRRNQLRAEVEEKPNTQYEKIDLGFQKSLLKNIGSDGRGNFYAIQ